MLAPAKINLMLHVTGKRADGYHLLQSLVMFADCGDDISYTDADDFLLTIQGEFAGALAGDNLISKAAHVLAKAANIKPRGHITLTKNLPIGAGLGGGSADAAAALKLCAQHWGCDGDLAAIAARLGSDIPACLQSTPLWMEETGHKTTPVSIPFDLPVLLVNPRIHVATPDVYRALTPPYDAPIALPTSFATPQELLAFLRQTRNALEAPALGLAPVIGEVLAAIKDAELVRMSGSGATCFAVFSTPDDCRKAADILQSAYPHWWVKCTILIGNP